MPVINGNKISTICNTERSFLIFEFQPTCMKRMMISALLLFILTAGYARKFRGYVITLKNDTLNLLIKVPGFINPGFSGKVEEVNTVDSLGNDKTYDYDAIKEFGYTKDSAEYIYKFKPTQNGMLYFLLEIIGGPKANCYHYELTDTHSVEEFFTFEKPTGEFLFLKNYDKLETLCNKLSLFYGDTPEIVAFISTKFKGRGRIQRDISEILSKVNGNSTIDFYKNEPTGLF
jgi:hypothetical protein